MKDVTERMHWLKVRGFRFHQYVDFVQHIAVYENMHTGYRIIVHMDTGFSEKIGGNKYGLQRN